MEDGAALVNRQILQPDEFRPFEKITDHFAGRMVDDHSGRAIIRRVMGQQNHGTVEHPVPQRWVGDQQLALQLDRRLGIGRRGVHAATIIEIPRFAN